MLDGRYYLKLPKKAIARGVIVGLVLSNPSEFDPPGNVESLINAMPK
jgi:hypothetical protein